MSGDRLSRTRPAPPVRMVHLGLGNFFRAHQAWYTHRANQTLPPDQQWGIAAFTGRSSAVADQLNEQDGLYTLMVDAADGSQAEVVESVVMARPGDDLGTLARLLARPEVAVLTTTVTEAGYCATVDGDLDLTDERVSADLDAWLDGRTQDLTTMPVRVAWALDGRRRAGAGGLTVVPCDNLPGNGSVARGVVLGAARHTSPELAAWIEGHVSFVSTAVDRITPRPTKDDVHRVQAITGTPDPAVVVTEPFVEWDLAGDFVAGRPPWETAGAVFTDDVRPYETRKLWLLNGAHSLLAYAGSIRGHETVSGAMQDEQVVRWVQEWWNTAIPHLALAQEELRAYTEALVTRFRNPAIRHLLAQIAADGSQKIPVRIVPALRAALETSDGRGVDGALRVLVAWVLHARGAGAPFSDSQAELVGPLVDGELSAALERVLDAWDVPSDVAPRALELSRELHPARRPDGIPGN
ncbi:mannitol dehydrogenase family protein [Ornithinimicrobium sp. W1679]|uniref:mannitol dehydrogenase family protein n=1 Tax=unclassified Ornithinimicrobium TaxID=2615080 RepID=UPI003CF98124